MKTLKIVGSVILSAVLVMLIFSIHDWGTTKQAAEYKAASSVWAVAHTDWRAGPDLPVGSAIVAQVQLDADVGILEEKDVWTETYSCGTTKAPATCTRTHTDWDLVDEARPAISPAKNDSYNFVGPNVTYPETSWYEDDLRYTGWRKGETVTLLAHRVDGGIFLEHICGYSPTDCVEALSRAATSSTAMLMWLGIGGLVTCLVFLLVFFVAFIRDEYLY